MILMNVGGNDTPADTGSRASSRAADSNSSWNNFAPSMVLNSNPTPSIWNDGDPTHNVTFSLTVSDDDKNASGNASTGGGISGVTVDLSEIGGAAATPMRDDGLGGDTTAGDNTWIYLLTTTYQAGIYYIRFNVSDNGSTLNGGQRWNNSDGYNSNYTWTDGSNPKLNVTLTINQVNRAPSATPNTAQIKFDEDMYNNTLDLSTYFSDPDSDTLTYKTNLTGSEPVQVDLTDTSAVNFTADANWNGILNLKIIGNDSATAASEPGPLTGSLSLVVTVFSVNDAPVFNAISIWSTENVTRSGDKFKGTQDMPLMITAMAADVDEGDTLTFDIENDAELPSIIGIDATSGEISFTPTNAEVGTHVVNISVFDDTVKTYKNITIEIANVNDEPMIKSVQVGTNTAEPVSDNKVTLATADGNGATEGTEFEFMVIAEDVDAGASLTFTEEGTSMLGKGLSAALTQNYTYTPTNADGAAGSVMFNISIKDSSSDTDADDFVLITIEVTAVNDKPKLKTPTTKDNDRGDISVGETDTVTVTAEDADGDSLTFSTTKAGITINQTTNTSAEITFTPTKSMSDSDVTVTITISDGNGGTDFVNFTWYVEDANEPPTVTITEPADNSEYEMGSEIVIKGNFSDDGGFLLLDLYIQITFPGGGVLERTSFDFLITDSEFDDLTTTEGTFEYSFNPENYEKYRADLEATGFPFLSDYPEFELGTFKFTAIAEEFALFEEGPKGEDSVSVVVKAKSTPPPGGGDGDGDGDEDKGMLGLGKVAGIDLFLLIIIIIIVVVIVLVAVMMKKKKPEEPVGEMPPAMPVACTACGAEIPPGSPTCPACGAPAPPPPAEAPPAPVACTACGAEIPPGAPNCAACGAPAPMPPAEAPPFDTVCECGATIPAGSPTCPTCGRPAPAPMPPEGAPPMPMGCPSCGTEIPPGAPSCPGCGAPAPPPQPPMEQPPMEGAPPMEQPPMEGAMGMEGAPPMDQLPPPEQPPAEAPPPAQMVACPTCGAQIGVGTTPCPGCGTALNWG